MTGFVYEVSLSIDISIQRDYLLWLRQHMAEMLTLGCFTAAHLLQEQVVTSQGRKGFRVFYEFSSPVDFKAYEDEWAPKMRNKLPAEFLNKVSIQRHILAPVSLEAL